MKIEPSDLVLEIGSGDNPKLRADVLCDMLPEDDTERGGEIVLGRPFIAADGQYLPFADKSFDYIICCHVLEHAEAPTLFLSELTRVGRGGYIEAPTEIGERLYGWPYHRWLINLSPSGKLTLKRKVEGGAFGRLFHHLYATDRAYAEFHAQNHGLFLVKYEWFGEIDYEIIEPNSVVVDLDSQDGVERLLSKPAPGGMSAVVTRMLTPTRARRWAKSAIVKARGRRRKNLDDIKSIIVCPACKGQVQWRENLVLCQNCHSKYPIKNGIPFLMADR